MNIISAVKSKIVSHFSFVKQARFAGVRIGSGNIFFSAFWESAEPYLISIGNNCQITKDVKIFTHGGSHVLRNKHPDFDCFGKVVIGDNVYVGNNALIMPGVSVGNNVVIAAGSVVTRSVPNNTVVGGNPAKIICTYEEYERKNSPYNLKTSKVSKKEKKGQLLKLPEASFIRKPYLQKK